MRFRILGPLEVSTDGTWQQVSAEKWRSLLACLLLRAGQVVPTDVLADELYGGEPPARAKNLVSIYVLRLRRLLGDPDGRMLAFRAPGYVLNIAPGDLDAARFGSLVSDGRRSLAEGDAVRAAALLSAALGLWRGSFLADVPQTPLIASHAERMAEQRLAAVELWAQAAIEADHQDEVIPELRGLVGENPLREGLWALLLRALDAAGRRAEALDAYAQARSVLADELGVDPGPELQRLYRDLLAADAASPASPGDAPPGGPASAAGSIVMGSYTSPSAVRDPLPAPAAGPPAPARAPGPGASAPPARPSTPAAAARPPAPADSAVPRPTQLPADIGDFTGREDHVEHLCDMLTGGASTRSPGAVPIAFVAGAGGLGKTTLAVHAAHKVRDQFPDGQLYVDLLGATAQPLPPGDVLARFLRELGVEGDRVPAGDEERAALYRTRLTGRRVLVLLDNARDTAQVRPLLPGSASCAVLVTTRNRTADLASTRFVDLNVLDDDEALALFSRILGDERPMAEPEATAEVLEACAGLPLAIRICAARLAARSHWRIATMAGRLRDVRRRLDELKLGDLAVRASFAVSYDSLQLQPGARLDPARVFRLLGMWQGPSISLPAAVALTGAAPGDEDALADVLEALVDAHLLESPEAERYRLHDLLRVYATERAMAQEPPSERRAAVERVLNWYLAAADAAAAVNSPHRYHLPVDGLGDVRPLSFLSAEESLAWYDLERANLVAATRQAASERLDQLAWQLPAALFPVFNRRGNWADCAATHRVALDCARATGNRQAEGWVRHNLGLALARMRDKEGLRYLEDALAIRREISDTAGEVQAALNIADAYYQLEGPQVALKYMVAGLEVVRETGRSTRYASALNNLGEVYLELGRLEEAAGCFTEAAAVVRDLGESYVEGHAMHNLGRAYLGMQRLADARDAIAVAISIHQSTGDRGGEGVALKFLGQVQRALADDARARQSWLAALAIFTSLGDAAQAAEVEAGLTALSL
ncbi:MAG TPA: BTAD domain-containing putative transcriptional regulator [Trebonia sp.]|jgi:DNA-binding SARP family transcriptional activator|nr:BTAD domain-containing putative transcriptional regulator [Trebonia sp.]